MVVAEISHFSELELSVYLTTTLPNDGEVAHYTSHISEVILGTHVYLGSLVVSGEASCVCGCPQGF